MVIFKPPSSWLHPYWYIFCTSLCHWDPIGHLQEAFKLLSKPLKRLPGAEERGRSCPLLLLDIGMIWYDMISEMGRYREDGEMTEGVN